jgi:uncharacterized membrane protein YdjX (TVP38/TMEM64 family)
VPARARFPLKWVVAGAAAAFVAVAFWTLRDRIDPSLIIDNEATVRRWIDGHSLLSLGLAFLLYVTVTGLSLPGATPLSTICGWLFGFWRGVLLVSFASTTGAMLAFLLSRYLFRETLQQYFGPRLKKFDEALEREGAFYLFALRLTPAVPYFVVNLAMGLTPIRARTYWWVSQLGMLPATLVFVWAGASVPSLKEVVERGPSAIMSPQLAAALIGLGVFPLVARRVVAWWRLGRQRRRR